MTRESYVLCEGYHDRAFWRGWLLHLGCTDPGIRSDGRGGRRDIRDPWGVSVTKGQHAYLSASDEFLRVVPCGGRDNILRAVRVRLRQRTSKALAHVVINVDGADAFSAEAIGALVAEFDPDAKKLGDYQYLLDHGLTRLSVVLWQAPDKHADGLPGEQTLERLVSAAILAAYPERGPAVQAWLNSRPEPPPKASVKDYSWSYMAGWYSERGCENFFSALWEDDPAIARELASRLEQSGAMRIANMLSE